ncbi:MAG: hypothetical protein GTO14_24320 [Anaerolineales bacterium]|nr:hypothetical protein [Anaerolineales bacterium]
MGEQLERLKTRLRGEGEKTAVFFENLQGHDWSQQVYSAGAQWGMKQVLAHLCSTEIAYLKLLGDMLSAESFAALDFDIDHFNQREVSAAEQGATHDLIEAFREAHVACLTFIDERSEPNLSKTGYHPRAGDLKINKILKQI